MKIALSKQTHLGCSSLLNARHTAIELDGNICNNIEHTHNVQNITNITIREILRRAAAQGPLIALAQNLPCLETIKFNVKESIAISTIEQMVLSANNLLEIQQVGDFSIEFNEHDYNEMLKMILDRENRKKLTIRFECIKNMQHDWYEKIMILNEHPQLTAIKFYKMDYEHLNGHGYLNNQIHFSATTLEYKRLPISWIQLFCCRFFYIKIL